MLRKNQLGDSAPGVMGLLAASMGLEQGPEGMKKLTQLMKQGKIGMKELFNFLDVAASRARETGAYDLAINSKTAVETRMMNSYKLFADSFGRMFDEEIKAPFKGFEKFFDRITTWIDEQEKLKKETGEIGKFETSVSLVTSLFGDLADGIMMVVEGWQNLLELLPGGKGMVGRYLATKELDTAYYASKGAKSFADKQALDSAGRPGYDEFRKSQFKLINPNATDEQYAKFVASMNSTGNPLAAINPTSSEFMFQNAKSMFPMFESMMNSLIQSSKESAQALIDAKYNNPLAPPVTINIQGATDPMANAIAVQDILKDQFRVPR